MKKNNLYKAKYTLIVMICNNKIIILIIFHFFIRYAKIEVIASAPIVPFRETVVVPPKVDMAHEIVENQVIIIIIIQLNL